MTALIFSDVHGSRSALQKLMDQEADYYICAGDLTNFGQGLDELGEIMRPRAGRVLAIPGNHETEAQMEAFCSRFGFYHLHSRSITAGRFTIAGLGYSNPTPFHTPGEYSELEMEKRLQPFRELAPLILIGHCPPKDTALDRSSQGEHFGSTSIRSFLADAQPEYFFCGHIHEAAGTEERLGNTVAVNAGPRGYLLTVD